MELFQQNGIREEGWKTELFAEKSDSFRKTFTMILKKDGNTKSMNATRWAGDILNFGAAAREMWA